MTDPFTPPAGDPSPAAPLPYGAPPPPASFGPPPPLYGDPYAGSYGPPAKKNGFGITALVLGIVGLLFSWVPVFGLVLAILAIVFAVLGRGRVKRREADNGGLAIAGLVTGIIGALIGAVVLVVLVFFVDEISDFSECVADAGGDRTLEQLCEDQLTNRISG